MSFPFGDINAYYNAKEYAFQPFKVMNQSSESTPGPLNDMFSRPQGHEQNPRTGHIVIRFEGCFLTCFLYGMKYVSVLHAVVRGHTVKLQRL